MIEEIAMHVATQLAIASFVVYVSMHKDTKLYICMTTSDHNNAARCDIQPDQQIQHDINV